MSTGKSGGSGYAGGGDFKERIDADGFMRTGDLARIDADGFVWIEGRLGDVIIGLGKARNR